MKADLDDVQRLVAGGGVQAVVAREVNLRDIQEAAWDGFAARCGGSVRTTRAHMVAWLLKYRFRYKLRLFEFYGVSEGASVKIGQCAVGIARKGVNTILGKLQIVPGIEAWSQVMAALLAETGPGTFEYGWELSMEPPRDEALAALPGVTIEESTPLVVHAIDFSQWDSWESYHRGMRKGARQSAQFAERDIPDLSFKLWTGRGAIRAIPALARLRTSLSRRKGLGLRMSELLASYLGWMILSPRYAVTSLALGGGRTLAAYYGQDFGTNSYYLEAASVPGNQGASWALLISMIKRAYEKNPKGHFVMGYVNYATHDEEVSGGLLRSRTACRVSEYPTSIIRFRYAG